MAELGNQLRPLLFCSQGCCQLAEQLLGLDSGRSQVCPQASHVIKKAKISVIFLKMFFFNIEDNRYHIARIDCLPFLYLIAKANK